MASARARGTDVQRDHQGLPHDIRLPESHTPPTQYPTRTRPPVDDYFFTPGGSRLSSGPVWPGRPAASSRENSSSTVTEPSKGNDSSPPGLLTQLEFDGIDDPRQTTASSPHGRVSDVPTQDEIEPSSSQRAESSTRPQVPDGTPPAFIKTRTDKDVFRAIRHTGDSLVRLSYLESLSRLPPATEKGRRPGGPLPSILVLPSSPGEGRPKGPMPAVRMRCNAILDESVPIKQALIEVIQYIR